MNEEHFARALDDLVAGRDRPATGSLTSFARQLQEQAASRIDDDRRRAIWRELMASHAPGGPGPGGPGPLSQPSLVDPTMFNPWVRREPRQEHGRRPVGIVSHGFQTSITALAVVAIIIAAFAAFPVIRGDRMPEITPTAFAAAPDTTSRDMPGATSLRSGTPSSTAPLPSGRDAPVLPLPGVTSATPPPPTPTPAPPPSVTYHHPQAVDCTVEPLTVDQVMAILDGKESGRGGPNGELRTRQPMDERTHEALAEAQQEWLACRIYGSPFQMWALESDAMIRAGFRQRYFPTYSMKVIRGALVELQGESDHTPRNGTFPWDPPKDTYLPMVPDYRASSGDVVYGNGSATLTIVWTNRNGVPLREDQTDIPGLATDLPNVWTFVWDDASGRWLLDGYGSRRDETTGP